MFDFDGLKEAFGQNIIPAIFFTAHYSPYQFIGKHQIFELVGRILDTTVRMKNIILGNRTVHDVNVIDLITYDRIIFYVAGSNKVYSYFQRLHKLHYNGSFFIIRANDNLQFKRMYSRAVDKTTGVINERISRLLGSKSKSEYPEKLRQIKYYNTEHNMGACFHDQ